MVAGLSWIARKSRFHELESVISEIIASPHLDYLLVTGLRDFSRFTNVTGSVAQGLKISQKAGRAANGKIATHRDEVAMCDFQELLQKLGIGAYAGIHSTHDRQSFRWLTCVLAVARRGDGVASSGSIVPGLSDLLFAHALRWLAGRSVFLFRPSPWQLRGQLALNACTGGRFRSTAQLLFASRGGSLQDKHFVFQEGPTIRPNGDIEFCSHCPDAVWQDNRLVPVCLADRMARGVAPEPIL